MISIIIPVYNAGKYLEECIKSVVEQTYADIEVILVNDGSTDDSEKICKKFEKDDKRIRVFSKENGGAAAARNVGLDNAQGEYIVFVDADDVIHTKFLEILMKELVENDADLVMCTFSYFSENPIFDESNAADRLIMTGRQCVLENYGALSVETVSPCLKLFKAKVFEGMRFPEGRVAEDEYIFYRVIYDLDKCVYIPKKLYAYRKYEGSVTTGNSLRITSDKVEAFREKADFFRERSDEELYIKSLRVCEILLAQKILLMDKRQKNDYLKEMDRYKDYFFSEILKLSFPKTDLIKFYLFIVNKKVYKRAKELADKKNMQKHLEKHLTS